MRFNSENELRELVRRFEGCELPLGEFTHGAHVAVAATYLQETEPDAALAKMRAGLLRFTAHYGKQDKYSEEVTRRWMERLAEFIGAEHSDLLGTVNAAVEKFRK
jgi:hypothetical protein